jgi:hypothetical protein
MKYVDMHADDISQLTLDTKTGSLVVTFPTSLETLQVQLHFSPQATRKLWEQLVRMQQALETIVEGMPPSNVRH